MMFTQIRPDQLILYKDFVLPSHRQVLENPEGKDLYAIAAGDGTQKGTVGFALGWGVSEKKEFELVTIYVQPFFRRSGVGRNLLEHLEKHFLERGLRLGAHFLSFPDDDESYPKFLCACGWKITATNEILCKSTLELAAKTPWLTKAQLPKDYQVRPWKSLDSIERAAIRARHEKEGGGWYAQDQNPFEKEEDCHGETSLALLKNGAAVGWVITHEPEEIPDYLRWTISFISPQIQGAARILPLWKEVYLRQKSHCGRKSFIWGVPITHPRMLRFARKHMRPWLSEMRYSCTALCDLEKKWGAPEKKGQR